MKPLAILALLVAVSTAPVSAREEPAPALAVEIAAPAHRGTRALDLAAVPVVVTNASGEDVRVWREWCSWGWYQLSFEIRDGDGNVRVVARKPRGWDKNYPDCWTIAPGEPLVLTVDLTKSDSWGWSGSAAELRGKSVEVRAVFSAEDDEATKEENAWHGRVASPWRTYRLR